MNWLKLFLIVRLGCCSRGGDQPDHHIAIDNLHPLAENGERMSRQHFICSRLWPILGIGSWDDIHRDCYSGMDKDLIGRPRNHRSSCMVMCNSRGRKHTPTQVRQKQLNGSDVAWIKRKICRKLFVFFRHSNEWSTMYVPIESQLDHTRGYFQVRKSRYWKII